MSWLLTLAILAVSTVSAGELAVKPMIVTPVVVVPSCDDMGLQARDGFLTTIRILGDRPSEKDAMRVASEVVKECLEEDWFKDPFNGTLEDVNNVTDSTNETLGDLGPDDDRPGVEAGCATTNGSGWVYEFCSIWCSWYPKFGWAEIKVEATEHSDVVGMLDCNLSSVPVYVPPLGLYCRAFESCAVGDDFIYKLGWGHCHFAATSGGEPTFRETLCEG